MKQILTWVMLLTLSMVATHCSRDDVQGINGTDGKDGTTILSGTSAPTLDIGKKGDYYLDKSTYDFYGPKTCKTWGTPINLRGRDGKDGRDGRDGRDGVDGKDGKDGVNGRDGVDGRDGIMGSKIHGGMGDPEHNIGNIGDWYIDVRNKVLYGPKTYLGWGSGFVLGSSEPHSLRGDYVLSLDGKKLLQWFNKDIHQIDMQSNLELREVTAIGSQAFKGIFLTSIILPNNLERIGNRAFMKNELTNISIPSSVKTIDHLAFYKNKLTNVAIPNGVTFIGNQAFSNNKLTSITIPNSVTTIGSGAFGNNPLMNVTINAVTPPTISGDIFPYTNPNLKIYVPAGSVAAYKTTAGWNQYASQIYAQ